MNRFLVSPKLIQWIARSEDQAVAKMEHLLQPRPPKATGSNLTKEKVWKEVDPWTTST